MTWLALALQLWGDTLMHSCWVNGCSTSSSENKSGCEQQTDGPKICPTPLMIPLMIPVMMLKMWGFNWPASSVVYLHQVWILYRLYPQILLNSFALKRLKTDIALSNNYSSTCGKRQILSYKSNLFPMGVLDVINGCSRVIAYHMTLKQQCSLFFFLRTLHEFKLRTLCHAQCWTLILKCVRVCTLGKR